MPISTAGPGDGNDSPARGSRRPCLSRPVLAGSLLGWTVTGLGHTPRRTAVSPHRGWGTARTCLARSSPHHEPGDAGAVPRPGSARPGALELAAAGHRPSAPRRRARGLSRRNRAAESSARHGLVARGSGHAHPRWPLPAPRTNLHCCHIHPGRFEVSGDGGDLRLVSQQAHDVVDRPVIEVIDVDLGLVHVAAPNRGVPVAMRRRPVPQRRLPPPRRRRCPRSCGPL